MTDQPTLIDVAPTPAEAPALQWPEWFAPGSTTPATHAARVARGLHPLGAPLSAAAHAKCGNCAHLVKVKTRSGKGFHKCALVAATAGTATDLRLAWRGCWKWVAADVPEVGR